MSIEHWSEHIIVAELQDEPTFGDDMSTLFELAEKDSELDMVLNFAAVTYVNSSNIAKLLKLRKLVVINNQRRVILCGVGTHVWGLFLVTGLDKVFEFVDNVAEGLAGVQIEQS